MFGEDAARELAELGAGMSDTTEGICVSVDWADRLVVVNIGGAEQVMPWAGSPPWAGERVRVGYWGRKPLCMAILGAPVGTVQTVGASTATVLGDDGVVYIYPFRFGDSLSAGNVVRLDHVGHLVASRYATTVAAPAFEVQPAPPAPRGSATFRPIDSGNYRNGVFDSQFVEISINRTGVLWYGAQIANTIPDSAHLTRADLSLVEVWDNVPGTPTEMGLHTQQTRGAEPTVVGTSNVSGTGVVSLLGSYADALRTGAYWGIGFRKATGWRRFDTFANSGSIFMEWE